MLIEFILIFLAGGLTLAFAGVTHNYCSTKTKSALLGFGLGIGVVGLGFCFVILYNQVTFILPTYQLLL